MSLYEKIINREEKISIIGLGYVGLPLAVAFARKAIVIGFDISEEKIRLYKKGIDPTKEIGNNAISKTKVEFTCDEKRLKEARFHIVAVPTPINSDKTPNLHPVESASRVIGRNLTKGSIVVFESTVYPGVTEDICVPILERESGFKCGVDFKVGYSPERINPGDKIHRLEKIVKIVAGMDNESLIDISKIYKLIIEAGVHEVSSIKVAEAAKVIENSQRDINIAFMNELAMVFDRMGIDTKEVVDAMNTKWNALGFTPGLVGGHCIGVDPYYFIYQAEKLGYHSQIILSGRKINDGMSQFITDTIIKQLILADKRIKNSRVAILGITFKEDCPDTRNSKVIDIINNLKSYGIELIIIDPEADGKETEKEYGIKLSKIEDINNLDALVLAVGHKQFKSLTKKDYLNFFNLELATEKVIIDIKSVLNSNEMKTDFRYWRL